MLRFFSDHISYVMISVGFIVASVLIWVRRDRANIKSVFRYTLLCIFFLFSAMISVSVFPYIEGFLTGNNDAGGLSSFGGYFVGVPILLVLFRLFKYDFRGSFDLFAIFGCIILAFARLGCILNGCCAGKFIRGTDLRWPTRISEVIFYVVLFIFLWRMLKKNEVPGQLVPIVMISYGCFRFVNQWFRVADTWIFGLDLAHIWSILCVCVGLSVWFEMNDQASRLVVHKKSHRRT